MFLFKEFLSTGKKHIPYIHYIYLQLQLCNLPSTDMYILCESKLEKETSEIFMAVI